MYIYIDGGRWRVGGGMVHVGGLWGVRHTYKGRREGGGEKHERTCPSQKSRLNGQENYYYSLLQSFLPS